MCFVLCCNFNFWCVNLIFFSSFCSNLVFACLFCVVKSYFLLFVLCDIIIVKRFQFYFHQKKEKYYFWEIFFEFNLQRQLNWVLSDYLLKNVITSIVILEIVILILDFLHTYTFCIHTICMNLLFQLFAIHQFIFQFIFLFVVYPTNQKCKNIELKLNYFKNVSSFSTQSNIQVFVYFLLISFWFFFCLRQLSNNF